MSSLQLWTLNVAAKLIVFPVWDVLMFKGAPSRSIYMIENMHLYLSESKLDCKITEIPVSPILVHPEMSNEVSPR